MVDGGARGKGVGKSLMRHAMEQADKLGAKAVDLTSRPPLRVVTAHGCNNHTNGLAGLHGMTSPSNQRSLLQMMGAFTNCVILRGEWSL